MNKPILERRTDLQAEQSLGIKVAGRRIEPGRRSALDLAVASLPTGTSLTMPLEVVCGAEPGPCIWLTATIHGEELNGLEIIRRVLDQLDPQEFRGAVIAAPVMNVLGFMSQTRTLPDGSDLNRSFPGSDSGSFSERVAHFFMKEVVARCSFGIDLHSGANNRINPPQIRADLEDSETRRLAEAFAAPILMNADLGEGSLRAAAVKAGKRVLLFEGGEPRRFNEDSLQCGTDGTLRVLHALGMREESPKPPSTPPIEVSSDAKWLKAPRCGILHRHVDVLDEVRQGQVVAVVADVLGANPEEIVAPFDGVVIGASLAPLVSKNGGVLHLVRQAGG